MPPRAIVVARSALALALDLDLDLDLDLANDVIYW